MATIENTTHIPSKSSAKALEQTKWKGVKPIPLAISIGIALSIWLIPTPAGLTQQAWHLFAIFMFIISGLVTRPLPVGAMVMMGSLLAIVTQTLTFEEIASGMSSSSIWLIFISFFLALGLIKTGLATRASYFFVKLFGKSTLGLAYGIIISELALAPFIPSLVARAGGIIFPIVLALAKAYDLQDETKSTGRFLIIATFQGCMVVSAMFLTSMAANPIAVELAKEFGVTISWGNWFLASSVPGIVSLALIPFIISKILPPKMTQTPDAPKLANEQLKQLGNVSTDEWLMIGVFAVVLSLWLFGSYINISNTVAAIIGLVCLLLTGIISWNDCLKENNAWDTLFWLGTIVAIGTSLKKLGFFTWFSMNVVSFITQMPWHWALIVMVIVYFYSHYFFASNTAHLTAMYSAFLAAAIQIGAPAVLTVLILSFFSSLFGGLTHYSCGPAPIFYSAGYLSLRKWWQIGLVISLFNILIWLIVGGVWWKILNYW